jgi:hypothetical protein
MEGEPEGEKSTAPGKKADTGVRPWYEGTVGGINQPKNPLRGGGKQRGMVVLIRYLTQGTYP